MYSYWIFTKTNYIDVTHEYWETSDVTIPLFNDTTHIIYACMFSMGRWNAEWWGERMENSVTFHNMPRGVVILPMIYKEHQLIPIGYPIVNGYNHQLYLVPDLLHTMTVEIEEQDRYLRFRPDKKYELFIGIMHGFHWEHKLQQWMPIVCNSIRYRKMY